MEDAGLAEMLLQLEEMESRRTKLESDITQLRRSIMGAARGLLNTGPKCNSKVGRMVEIVSRYHGADAATIAQFLYGEVSEQARNRVHGLASYAVRRGILKSVGPGSWAVNGHH